MTPDLDAIRAALIGPDHELLRECELAAFRGSGPGGQKRNKTSSAVRLRHLPSGLAAEAADTRSQATNRSLALRRLRHALAYGFRLPAASEGYNASPALRGLIARSVGPKNPLYPQAIAELLDLLEDCELALAAAASRLDTTTATLAKRLVQDPQLLQHVNRRRLVHGLHALRT